ncbi:hypothetical protein V4D00_17425 [Ralstonia solanacearum]|uniref:hypothetical protein n=1 Tax=Ralstonia solanacearum TaxID=305 RepID=UPI002F920A19
MESRSNQKKTFSPEKVVHRMGLLHPQPEGDGRSAATTEDSSSEKAAKLASWKVLAPLIGALTVYAAHLVGVAFRETYLGSFGISPGAFPKGQADYLVYAVQAMLQDFGAVLRVYSTSKAVLTVFGVLAAVGVFCLVVTEVAQALGRRFNDSKRVPPSPRVKLLIAFLLALPLIGTYLTFAIPTVFVSVMIVPVELGVIAAKSVATDDVTDFQQGCAAHAHGKRCIELRGEKNETIATGFIIEQSKDLIALWDNGIVKVLPMNRKGLVSTDSLR